MRCIDCGYLNDAAAKVCIKCATKLQAHPANVKPRNPTLRGGQSIQSYWDAPEEGIATRKTNPDVLKCEKCNHYPLVEDANHVITCSNCGFSKRLDKTNVRQKEQPSGKGFTLTDVHDGRELNFSGESISLNRSNLDADNKSISNGLHAEIYFENGSWKIVDKSSNHATFIQVTGERSLPEEGTIILGNKLFRFEAK